MGLSHTYQVQDSGCLWEQEGGKWDEGGIQKGLYL